MVAISQLGVSLFLIGAVSGANATAASTGVFGNWTIDGGGMPAYSYTLDQSTAEGAKIASTYYSRFQPPPPPTQDTVTDNICVVRRPEHALPPRHLRDERVLRKKCAGSVTL